MPEIRKYLPATALLTQTTLQNFLAKHGSVYVKPSSGWGGRGITKVWKRPEGGYSFIVERGRAVTCKTEAELYQKLRAGHRSGIVYIVQKAISLAKIQGRPFDIRLMMMRVNGKWEYVGMLAKVAGPNSVVTNIARGKGYVTDIDTALQKSLGLSEARRTKLKKEMIQLGHRTVKRFEDWKHYSQIGLDLAVDTKGKIWMIEENTGPALSLFAKLKNKSMYFRIMQIVDLRRKARNARKGRRSR